MPKALAVLNVEDSKSDSDLIARLLQKAGYELTFKQVESAAQMRSALKKGAWDVVIADFKLPQFDGHAALKLLQETGLDIPFIAVSGTIGEETAVAMMKAGAQDYLMKDNLARLVPAIERELEQAEVRRRRVQTEQALVESEKQYRLLFENAPVGVFQSTPEGRYLRVNSALAHIFGFDSAEEMIAGITDIANQIYVEPEKRREFVRRLAKDGQVMDSIKDNYRKDGSRIWTSTNARAVRDGKGKILYYEGFMTDITERKLAEDAQRESEKLLKNAQIIAGMGNYVLDIPGGNWKSSEALDRVFGIDETFDRSVEGWAALIHADDRQQMVDYLTNEVIGKRIRFDREYRIVRDNDKVERWVHGLGELEVDARKQLVKMHGTVQDVTERKLANEELHSAREFLQGVQNSLSAHIAILDQDGVILDVNSAWRKFGKENGLKCHADCAGINYLGVCDTATGPNSEEAPLVAQAIREILAGKIDTARFEYPCHSPEAKRWFLLNITSFEDKDRKRVVLAHENITERRQVEEALRESEKRFSTVFHASPNVATVTRLRDNKLIEVNDAWLDLCGYTREEAIGRTSLELGLWVDSKNREHMLDLLDKQGMVRGLEIQLKKKSGELADLLFSAERVMLADEAYMISMAMDITERRRAEETLHASEERFRVIFEKANDAIHIENGSDEILSVNSRMCELMGYSREELLKMHVADLQVPERRKPGNVIKNALARHGGAIFEALNLHRDGRHIPVEISIGRIELPSEDLYISVVRDITERKQAEEKLSQTLERLNLATHAARLGIWDWNLQKNELIWDERMYELYGVQKESFGGAYETWLNGLHPDDRATSDEISKQAQRGEREYDTEFRVIWPDGSIHYLKAEGQFVRGNDGTALRMTGVNYDITERTLMEDRLHESEHRYRALFEDTPIPIWEEDFSEVKKHLDSLKQQGITDLRAHFASHPEAVVGCANLFRILDVNKAAMKMYRARTREELIESTMYLLSKGEQEHIPEDFCAIAEGRTGNSWEGEDETLAGEPIEISLSWSVVPGHEDDFSRVIVTTTDITDRKWAQRAAEEHYKLFSSAFEHAPFGMTLIATDGRFIKVNQSLSRIIGFSEEELLVRTFQEITHPDDLEADLKNMKKLLAGEIQTYQVEKRYFHKSGRIIWVVLSVSLIRDNQGKPSYFIAQIMDTTERREAVERLRASEERFTQLADHIQEAFWMTDIERDEEIYLSPAAETIWGRPVEELLQPPAAFLETVLAEDRNSVMSVLAKQRLGEKTEMEYRIRRPDGSVRWVWDRAFPILVDSGKVKILAGIAADITERKQAEIKTRRHLAELEALYQNGLAVGQLLEPGEIGERIIRTFAQHLSWHHVVIRLKHPEKDELELIAFNQPGMREEERAEIERHFNSMISRVGQGLSGWVVQTGEAFRTGNVKTHPKYAEAHKGINSGLYMPLKTGGDVIGVISVESEELDAFTAEDERLLATLANQAAISFENARLFQTAQQELSERKRMEITLAEERNQLAIHVKERTADLSRANANLARALRVKDEFLANMSHELRTPLNAILGLSESLEEQIAGPLNEKQLKYISTIGESGRHLLSLINDILDLAKIEAGQIMLDINKVDIRSVCQASLRMIKQMSQKRRQAVSLQIDDDIGLIWADERRLKQMIVNLLSNAVKFTPEDGRLGIEVHRDQEESTILITIWDNGIGISETDLTRVFRPFVQVDSGLARETAGTGLGLALVVQMARLHGGRVDADSQPGSGSRFTIVLPWTPALRADLAAKLRDTGRLKLQNPEDKNKKTILVVEDTQEMIMMIQDYLENTGYRVITARDGVEGIEQVKLASPDLILMDIMMPRLDGYEATRRLRADPQFGIIPIIGMTALAMPNDRERCLEAGMNDYISKPVNLKGLVKMIQTILAGSRERDSK